MAQRRIQRVSSQLAQYQGYDTSASEDRVFRQRVQETEAFLSDPRFEHITRPYGAEDVVKLQGTVDSAYPVAPIAAKLYKLLRQLQAEGKQSHTFGSLDTIQVTQMAKYMETIYVSGWQSSSTASTSNEPGPDIADYPYDTVPNKVDQLFRAQLFHDRKQYEDRRRMSPEERMKNPPVDYMRPIVADGDTGHGGLTATMKLVKMFIERGASGVHLEDQKPGTKKCGHMGGKVLVSMKEHQQRLIAARLQADILKTPLVLVARTDAEAATLLDNNSDPRDQPFILGATNLNVESFADASIHKRADGWDRKAGLCTYPEAVRRAIKASNRRDRAQLIQEWNERSSEHSLEDMKKLAKEMGFEVDFCWEKARTVEGYYRVQGGVEYCIARGRAYAPYADLIWMETALPGIPLARTFAEGVKSRFPHQMLAYNLSPSFNWDKAGMSDQEIRTFIDDLGKLGYCWQFITLAGFHSDSLGITRFARDYASRKMLAYVEGIQRAERKEGVETLRHQAWSGTQYIDAMQNTITGGLSSVNTMASGVTESQF